MTAATPLSPDHPDQPGPDALPAGQHDGQHDGQPKAPAAHSRLGASLLIVFAVALGLFVAWGIWRAANPPRPPLQGQMEARTLSIASKSPGRVGRVLVKEGDFVVAGEPLVEMSLPGLEARLAGAQAQEGAAAAQQSLVDAGARSQDREAARAEWERVEAEAALAATTWRRLDALYRDGLISAERHDEARARMVATRQAAVAAREQYDAVRLGARTQEREAAADATREAAAGVAAIASLADDRVLYAPDAGQVDQVVLVRGEIAAAGFPVLTIVRLDDQWATFNIREEEMPGVVMGGILAADVPAIGAEAVPFRITYISPRASYATWRSTRQYAGYDMKTFEVHARPVSPVKDLRPGMSVLVSHAPDGRLATAAPNPARRAPAEEKGAGQADTPATAGWADAAQPAAPSGGKPAGQPDAPADARADAPPAPPPAQGGRAPASPHAPANATPPDAHAVIPSVPQAAGQPNETPISHGGR